MVGKRHSADMNQNIAEPHAVTMIPASTYDLIITPHGRGHYTADPNYPMGLSACSTHDGFEHVRFWHLADMAIGVSDVRYRG